MRLADDREGAASLGICGGMPTEPTRSGRTARLRHGAASRRPQGVDGVQAGGLVGGKEAEEDAHPAHDQGDGAVRPGKLPAVIQGPELGGRQPTPAA